MYHGIQCILDKRIRRKLENIWRESKLKSDHVAYRKQCSIVARDIYTAKLDYYSRKIEEARGDNKSMFNCCCCCLPTPMALASGGSPMFPLVVHQPASPSFWPAMQSLRRGLSTNPGATMWCVCGCS